MSCEPLKKLLRKPTNRPSFDFFFAAPSVFCCAEASVEKAITQTVAMSTTRRSTATTNDQCATRREELITVDRSIMTPHHEAETVDFGYRNAGFSISC